MTRRIETRWLMTTLAGLSLALLIALSGAFAVQDTAEAQGKSLSFDDPPTEVSVTSGTADKNVVKIRASGINNQKRIRYSISGDSAFSVTPKTGRVKYDGSPIDSGASIELTVTARDVKGKYESVSHTFKVNNSVIVFSTSDSIIDEPWPPPTPTAQPSPTPTPTPKPAAQTQAQVNSNPPESKTPSESNGECSVGLVLENGDSCVASNSCRMVVVKSNGQACNQSTLFSGREHTMCVLGGTLTVNGLGVGLRQGKWTITSVP